MRRLCPSPESALDLTHNTVVVRHTGEGPRLFNTPFQLVYSNILGLIEITHTLSLNRVLKSFACIVTVFGELQGTQLFVDNLVLVERQWRFRTRVKQECLP